MIKKESGFTLIELMVTMVIFVFAIAAASQMFIDMLSQFKQQGKIAETQIEGIVGLELLRRDIEHSGYGLPWNPDPLPAYAEAVDFADTAHSELIFNDAPADPPRAILSGNGIGMNGSDVLVIKAVNVATNAEAQRWTRLGFGNDKRDDLSGDTFTGAERIIIISPGNTDANSRTLVGTTTYIGTAGFAPPDNSETYLVYGVDPSALRMPFNRADYYIRTPAANMPARCANGTGILYKATVNHGGLAAGDMTEFPILDCVADMQVDYQLDTNDNGVIDPTDTTTDDLAGYTAEDIRQIKEVRVYILAHEGQRNRNYTFTNFTGSTTCPTCIRVGRNAALGQDFDLNAIADFQNYRWKVYTIVVKTNNLG